MGEPVQIAGFSKSCVTTRRGAPDPGREGAWLHLVNPDREQTGRVCITGQAQLPASFTPPKRNSSRRQGHVCGLRRSEANGQAGDLPDGQTGKRASVLTTARAGNQAAPHPESQAACPSDGRTAEMCVQSGCPGHHADRQTCNPSPTPRGVQPPPQRVRSAIEC
jgi:hypothetical protein